MDSNNGKKVSCKKPVIVLIQWLWVLGMIITSTMGVLKEVISLKLAWEKVLKTNHNASSMTWGVGRKHNEYNF